MRGLSANTITLDDLGYNQSEETQVTEDNQSEETTSVTLDNINEMINNQYNSRRYMNMWGGLCEEMSSAQARADYYQRTSELNPARIDNSLDSLHRSIAHLRGIATEQMGNLSRTRTDIESINIKIDKIEQRQKTIDEKLDFIIGSLNTLELEKTL